MNKDILKSSLKAYCKEIIKEISTLGGEGSYNTKISSRKTKPQDIKSLTGYESSPLNNYYKKFKFKLVNPIPLTHSKPLWEQNQSTISDFPIEINSWEQGRLVKDWLEKYGYELKGDTNLFNQKINFPFYINHMKEKTLGVSSQNKIYEIKINNYK